MDDVWDKIEDEYIKSRHNLKMGKGIYVFKFVKAYEKVRQDNDYKKATPIFKQKYDIETGKVESYYLKPFDIRIMYCECKPIIGRLAHVELSNKVFMSLAELRLRLKRLTDTVVGEIVVYWKPTKTMVKMALLTEEMWDEWKEYIEKENVEAMNRYIYWYGRQEKFDEVKFKEFYL